MPNIFNFIQCSRSSWPENGGRTTHSKTVGYVPQGRDATIAYPYLDLVFENTNDAPVKLYMGIQGGKLVAEVHKMR